MTFIFLSPEGLNKVGFWVALVPCWRLGTGTVTPAVCSIWDPERRTQPPYKLVCRLMVPAHQPLPPAFKVREAHWTRHYHSSADFCTNDNVPTRTMMSGVKVPVL